MPDARPSDNAGTESLPVRPGQSGKRRASGSPIPHAAADSEARDAVARAALAESTAEGEAAQAENLEPSPPPGRPVEDVVTDLGHVIRASWLGVGLLMARRRNKLPNVPAAQRWSRQLSATIGPRVYPLVSTSVALEIVGALAGLGADLLESVVDEAWKAIGTAASEAR